MAANVLDQWTDQTEITKDNMNQIIDSINNLSTSGLNNLQFNAVGVFNTITKDVNTTLTTKANELFKEVKENLFVFLAYNGKANTGYSLQTGDSWIGYSYRQENEIKWGFIKNYNIQTIDFEINSDGFLCTK